MTGLMFIPLAIGVVMSAFFSPLINIHYLWMCRRCPGKPPAEYRLVPMMFSCWFIPIGLFIFGWTSYPWIHWFGPAIGGWPVGFGFIFLYNSANNYLGMSPSFFDVHIPDKMTDKGRQWIRISTKQHLHSQRKRSFGQCGVPVAFCSPSKCTSRCITNGPVRFLPSLVLPVAPSLTFFGGRERPSVDTLNTPLVTMMMIRKNHLKYLTKRSKVDIYIKTLISGGVLMLGLQPHTYIRRLLMIIMVWIVRLHSKGVLHVACCIDFGFLFVL